MSDAAITTHTLGQIGTPLDGTMQEKWQEVHEQVRANLERAQKEAREAPRKNFFAAAQVAGFTEAQVEFLWGLRPPPLLSEWKA